MGKELHLKFLIKNLIEKQDTWNVKAFSHPDILLNTLNDGAIFPDIIIYDWFYQNIPINSKDKLLEILNKSSAFVYIYTAEGEQGEIDKELPEFKDFAHRIEVIEKRFYLQKNLPKRYWKKI